MATRRAHNWLIWFNWILLVVSLLGWPFSALTFARNEPQAVLGLSWVAITLTALSALTAAYVGRKVDEE